MSSHLSCVPCSGRDEQRLKLVQILGGGGKQSWGDAMGMVSRPHCIPLGCLGAGDAAWRHF